MLSKRIIPCLDVLEGRVVKGVNFVDLRDAGDPIEQAVVYDREGADELVFLDITASHEGRNTTLDMVRQVADNVFIPYCVGGGIRNLADIRATLLAGADKVSINSAAIRNPDLIDAGAWNFGSQCIVVAIDPAAPGKASTKSSSMAAGCRPGATPSTGRGKPSPAGPVKSCSPAWTPTGPWTVTTST